MYGQLCGLVHARLAQRRQSPAHIEESGRHFGMKIEESLIER
jgi:3-dehydroquinate synthase class II